MEYKNLNFNYNYKGDHVIEGFASVFDVIDLKGDMVMRGAMSASLKKYHEIDLLPAMLLEHDILLYAGLWITMCETKNGLYVMGKILSSTPGGELAVQKLSQRALIGLSIGYEAISSYITDGVRCLTQIELYEVSLVEKPANQHALIFNVSQE